MSAICGPQSKQLLERKQQLAESLDSLLVLLLVFPTSSIALCHMLVSVWISVCRLAPDETYRT